MLLTELQGGLIAFFQRITKLMTDQSLHLSHTLILYEYLYPQESRLEISCTLRMRHNKCCLHSIYDRGVQGCRCGQANASRAFYMNTST